MRELPGPSVSLSGQENEWSVYAPVFRRPEVASQRAKAVLAAIAPALKQRAYLRYYDFISSSLSLKAKEKFDMETTGFYRFKTPWLRKAQDEGIQKGIEKGIKKGLKKGIETGLKTGIKKGIEKGIVRGEVNGRVAALLALAEARELRLSAAQRKRIRETRSLRQLDRWLRRAATAESASGLFPQ